MLKKLLVLLLILINSTMFSFAQESVTLEEALNIAKENNPEIKSAISSLPISEAGIIIAKYIPNPKIGSFNEIVTGGSIHPLQLSTDLELGKKRYWRVQIAQEQVSKTELEIAKVLWETHTKVHIAYAALAIKQKIYNLAEERTAFYKSLLDITNKRFEAGDVPKLEIYRAETELLNAENQLAEIKGKLKQSKIEFNHLLGRDQESEIIVSAYQGLKPKVNIAEHQEITKILEDARAKRLEIAILEKDFGITRAQLKKAEWERIPNFSIEASYTKPSLGNGSWGPYVGGQFELPVFNRKQGEIKEAKARLEFLEKERARIEQDIKAEVAIAYKDIQIREEQFQRFEDKLLEESENMLEIVKFGYQKGKLSFTDILTAELRNREINELYLESIFNYQVALASLEYAVGIPLYNLGEKS